MAAESTMSIAVPAAGADPAPIGPLPRSRVRQRSLTESERNFSIAIHLSPLAGFAFGLFFFTPIVLWLIRRNESEFNDDHGREMTNAIISFVIYNFVAGIMVLLVIGIPALIALWVIAIVNMIRGAVAAGRGEYFRYPMTIRFIS
jgi:uncharacterized Tic20 family protein